MHKRIDPRQMAQLVAVQRVRRAVAEEALALACGVEADARAAEATTKTAANAARADWLECLTRPGFALEYWRALALRLTVRETIADDAAEATQVAIDRHARRQDDWRTAEARVTAIEARHTQARRDAAQRREDLRLSEMIDRVTRDWIRR